MRKKLISVCVICLFTVAICIPAVLKADGTVDFHKLGKEVAANRNTEDASEIIFENEKISITKGEMLQMVTGYSENGLDEEAAVEEAVASVVEKKYLYRQAIQAGMEVTEEEYENYKEALMSSIGNAENKENADAYLEGFGGEEEYWRVMEESIKENLLVRKYLDSQIAQCSQMEAYSNDGLLDLDIQQELENEIKREAYHEALTDGEKEELLSIAHELYADMN